MEIFWAFHFSVLKGTHGVVAFDLLRILDFSIFYSDRDNNVIPAHEVRCALKNAPSSPGLKLNVSASKTTDCLFTIPSTHDNDALCFSTTKHE